MNKINRRFLTIVSRVVECMVKRFGKLFFVYFLYVYVDAVGLFALAAFIFILSVFACLSVFVFFSLPPPLIFHFRSLVL